MKKTVYIFSALLMLAACSKEIQEPVFKGEELPEGTLVKTTFTVSYPKDFVLYAETRALEEKPDIENMYLALFGSTELQYWIPATLVSKPAEGEYAAETKYEYEAMLPVTDSPLQIHFIGNVPAKYTGENAEIPQFSGSTQEKVMNEMISENMKGGYWQKINVKYIKATKSGNTTTVSFGDNISLDDVPLVRNYAKITYKISEATEDYHPEFELLGYTLINVPKKAYIAPWQSGKRYDNYYRQIVGAKDFYNSLLEDGYTGYTPDLSIDAAKTVEAQPERTENATNPVYMYERPLPDVNNQTAVIAKIKWKDKWNTETMGDPANPNEGFDPANYILPEDSEGDNPNYTNGVARNTYYYKIALADKNDLPFAILRNIHYTINLESITGPGSESYVKALEGPFFGNVSSSMEAANLTDITDNKTRLVVNKTNFTYLAENTATVKVEYYPEASNDSYVVTNVYTTTPESTAPYVYLEVLSVSDSHGNKYEPAIAKKTVDNKQVDDITINEKDGKKDGTISVKTVGASENNIRRSKIRLTGVTSGKRKLYREITITVMPKQDLTDKTRISSETVDGKKKVTVSIGLPDELSYDIFPLTFKIEAEKNNLSTNDTKLPVGFGPSAWTTGKNSYYFIKTITWAEYCKIISGEYHWITKHDCELFATDEQSVKVKVTNFAEDENGATEDNKYFKQMELDL